MDIKNETQNIFFYFVCGNTKQNMEHLIVFYFVYRHTKTKHGTFLFYFVCGNINQDIKLFCGHTKQNMEHVIVFFVYRHTKKHGAFFILFVGIENKTWSLFVLF